MADIHDAIGMVMGNRPAYNGAAIARETIEIDCLTEIRTEKVGDYARYFAHQTFRNEYAAKAALGDMAGRIGRAAEIARKMIAQAPIAKAEIETAFGAWRAKQWPAEIALIRRNQEIYSAMIAGPSNFPFERMRKREAAKWKEAERMEHRVTSFAKTAKRIAFPHGAPGEAIRGNDPEAIAKIRTKIAQKTKWQEQMKAHNAEIRKAAKITGAGKNAEGDALIAAELQKTHSAAVAAGLAMRDYAGRRGHASYALTNNRAEIARLEARLKELERVRESAAKELAIEIQGEEIQLIENTDAHRIQIIFPDKPTAEIRTILKRRGFRWAPSMGAWQRHLNANGRYAAQCAIAEIEKAAA